MTDTDYSVLSRRRILKATGGSAGSLAIIGTTVACDHDEGNGHGDGHGNGHGNGHDDHGHGHECPYENIGHDHDHGDEEDRDPVHEHILCPDHPEASGVTGHTMAHVNAAMEACPTGSGLDVCPELDEDEEDPDIEAINEHWPDCTDWPQPTIDLVEESREALTGVYNEVGTLIARGYIPYFDVVTPGATGGVSHWLNPDYIGDEHYEPRPYRPESIVFDNEWWKPLGPMYIATDEGDVRWHDEDEEIMEVREAWGFENECGECFPFHPHNGVAGRFAWWYYRQVHEQDAASGEEDDIMLPCYTAPMMHSWIYPTPEGPHGDTGGAPPQRYRPGGPPNTPGYPAPVDPTEAELSLEVLPEPVRETAMPERLSRELEIVDELDRETLETTPVGELEALMDERLGPVGDDLDAVGSLDVDPEETDSSTSGAGGL